MGPVGAGRQESGRGTKWLQSTRKALPVRASGLRLSHVTIALCCVLRKSVNREKVICTGWPGVKNITLIIFLCLEGATGRTGMAEPSGAAPILRVLRPM